MKQAITFAVYCAQYINQKKVKSYTTKYYVLHALEKHCVEATYFGCGM
jgi:hypothetical protein